MATSKTPAAPKPETPAPGATDTPPAADAKPAFDWSTLAAPVVMANKPAADSKRVDVIAEVPEAIRQRIEISLMKTVARQAAKANSSAKRVRVDPYWQLQPVPSLEHGADFVKLALRYAKYRPADREVPFADSDSPKGQITVRCGTPGHYRQTEHGPVLTTDTEGEGIFVAVRYSARPFEGRTDAARAPGSAS